MRLRISESAKLPTSHGLWRVTAFYDPKSGNGERSHIAMVYGKIAGAKELLTRVHSECLTSEVFGSKKCDCRHQLDLAMKRIRKAGRGLIIYMRQEGRGIGLFNKIRAYHLQDNGLDTVEANAALGLPQDSRAYHDAAAVLRNLKVRSIRLMTNNPKKHQELLASGVPVTDRQAIRTKPISQNRKYLSVKKRKMSHDL